MGFFKEYPYLYEGTVEQEHAYLNHYVSNPQAMLLLALDDTKLVGASTGIPLIAETILFTASQSVLQSRHIDPMRCYYYGEIMVDRLYQGRGIANALYQQQGHQAIKLGFEYAVIMTVMRPDNHPQKPKGYRSTDTLWPKLGFEPLNVTVDIPWSTIQADGSVVREANRVQCWVKKILSDF